MARHFAAFESPDAALNHAVRWAVERLGGHLRVEPVGAGLPVWDDDELAELIDDARRWDRVRAGGILDPADVSSRIVGGLWGARIDAGGGRLELVPSMPAGWKSMAIHRLRAYRTLLDLELRARAEWATLKIAVKFGPPIPLLVRLPEPAKVVRVTVDEIPLDARQAIFTAQQEHEVTLFRGG
jgi:hypothetical protein